jgi:hypothetical protein
MYQSILKGDRDGGYIESARLNYYRMKMKFIGILFAKLCIETLLLIQNITI